MQIENSNQTGVSTVGDFVLRYTIKRDKDNNPVEVRADVFKGFDRVGFCSCDKDLLIGISTVRDNPVTISEAESFTTQFYSDVAEVFGGQETDEETEQASE